MEFSPASAEADRYPLRIHSVYTSNIWNLKGDLIALKLGLQGFYFLHMGYVKAMEPVLEGKAV